MSKRKIVLVDLKFATYIYHSTPTPSMATCLLSGYHKECGDHVIFSAEPVENDRYDLVYYIKDEPYIFHDPSWIVDENVILVGDYWGGEETQWEGEWEEAMPDMSIYSVWINAWIEKYPKYSQKRILPFFFNPVKIKQNGKYVVPEGKDLVIIDNDMHIWDEDCYFANAVNSRYPIMLYPMVLDGRWEAVLECFKKSNYRRKNLWHTMYFENYTPEDIDAAVEAYDKSGVPKTARIKCFVTGSSNEEWIKLIPQVYEMLGKFRMGVGKRIFTYPREQENFDYPRILQELKRWSSKDMGYAKNSLFDYMIYDGCRNTVRMAEFFSDPYRYLDKKKQGSNKFIELVPFIEEYPELMDVITKSYNKAGG